MALVIVSILLVGYVLIATGHLTKVNRAAVAMFVGTVGWVLYICYGTDFVMSQHPREYAEFLSGALSSSSVVKQFIAQDVFLKYVAKAAEVVLFLLATMTIVEILGNNGCFDFLSRWVRTRNSRRMLWAMALVTFLLSANLDNLTTATMMLVIMRKILQSRRQRIIYGCAIVLAANCGGCLTVIGDPIGLVLWSNGAVEATNFSASLALPCILACCLPVLWLSRLLPERIDIHSTTMPYRGDDTNLNLWQRFMMLVVGIGGLWFIPTFHNITKLSPFLGALCVLAVLWVVNEIFNRKLLSADQLSTTGLPHVLQYGVIQLMLFVMGIMLAMGAVRETGVITYLTQAYTSQVHSIWGIGVLTGCLSGFLDTFATFMTVYSLYPVVDEGQLASMAHAGYMSSFVTNGLFWKITAYSAAMGGNILLLGSVSGLALMRMERVHAWWYFKNVGFVVAIAWLLGLLLMWAVS